MWLATKCQHELLAGTELLHYIIKLTDVPVPLCSTYIAIVTACYDQLTIPC